MAEGTLHGRTRDDALLPDADRDALGGVLPRRGDAVVDQHHQFLAAMAAAPRRVLSAPRGDLRQSRARVPSRWLLDSVSALAGTAVTSQDFDDVRLPGVTRVASFAAGVTDAAHHVSLAERDLADLHRWVGQGRRADTHPLALADPALGAGYEVLDHRRNQGFNRFTGEVHGVELPTFRSGVALSPTALERWAACPRRYFFAQVLRVRARETPEFVDRISAASKGSLVHEVLDRFYKEVLARPHVKPSAEAWTDAERQRVGEIFDEVCREFEDEGLVGRRVLWDLDRIDIEQEVMRFLDHDDDYRRVQGAVPVATELPFGPDAASDATLDLPGGRHVSFKGFADRVDRRADGSLVVLDYKTGRLSDDVRRIADDDTFVGGTKLQLPVYALAAATAHGTPDTPVRAAYWHITSRDDFTQAGYDAGPERRERFVTVLTQIADGIEGGVFPAYPGEPDTRWGGFTNCGWCDFDAVCGRNRLHEWERVRVDPAIAGFLALRAAPDDESGGASGDGGDP
jgi:ATP-dependent helicase/nuclease subunit B